MSCDRRFPDARRAGTLACALAGLFAATHLYSYGIRSSLHVQYPSASHGSTTLAANARAASRPQGESTLPADVRASDVTAVIVWTRARVGRG